MIRPKGFWARQAIDVYTGLKVISPRNIPNGCTELEVKAMELIRGRDLWWLLIPILGPMIFCEAIDDRGLQALRKSKTVPEPTCQKTP